MCAQVFEFDADGLGNITTNKKTASENIRCRSHFN